MLALSAGTFTGIIAPATAKPQPVPSTHITIDVPDGYEVAKAFGGFANPATGASIAVVELPPQAFVDFKSADFAAKLAASGFADVAPGKLNFPSDHIYVTAEQASPSGPVSKFVLIFTDA